MSFAGTGIDVTFIPASKLLTSTSQYKCVALANTTSSDGDSYVYMTGCSGPSAKITPTSASFHVLGINQSVLSAGSLECNVRMLGISKAVCAHSIQAGNAVVAYWGASTTERAGCIMQIVDGQTLAGLAGAQSTSTFVWTLGRALESGSTATVISVFVNPSLYEFKLIGSITAT